MKKETIERDLGTNIRLAVLMSCITKRAGPFTLGSNYWTFHDPVDETLEPTALITRYNERCSSTGHHYMRWQVLLIEAPVA